MPEILSKLQTTYNLQSITQVAKTLISHGKTEPVWLFYGDLGAGKTTLIKEVCLQLGVDIHFLSSPTFSIINEYPSRSGTVYHFDFYRLKGESEVLDLGIEEYFDSGNFCFVEWPDRLGSLMPSDYLKISILHSNDTERIIEYEKYA